MKRAFITFVLSSACWLACLAIPANPDTVKVLQPDGSHVSIVQHGDEFLNFTTTVDGYTVVCGSDGYWQYAVKSGGELMPAAVIARDAGGRTPADEAFLASVPKYLAPEMKEEARQMRASRKAMKAGLSRAGRHDYSMFRGLVILVEFSDRKFLRDDTKQLFSDMINKENYEGYMSDAPIPELIPCTGSVHDYFRDNSDGMFAPQFDVVGPVEIDALQTDPKQVSNAQNIVADALRAADGQVDYSLYDTDGNGEVDMVYFIFAGGGSNVTGNDNRYIWPHASSVYSLSLDGVRFGRYACSTELYGREESGIIDGIGTMVHEFSHVLGLPDEYDTDYTGSGGQSVHPARWSVMASGSYLNNSRTPCGYSLYERYAAGFATPERIDSDGTFTLKPLNTDNRGYRIDCSVSNEYFLLENRQQTRWDAYLPGHGMLIFRVDSTDASVWSYNTINADPAHNYYELLRAKPKTGMAGSVTDSGGDPFPGTGGVTAISNSSTPSLSSWTGAPTALSLTGIEESNGVITFSTVKEKLDTGVEDFEDMPLTVADTAGVEGKFCLWTFENATVEAPGEGLCNGKQAVGVVKTSVITTSAVDRAVRLLSFTINNPTSQRAILRCYYSVDGGAVWASAKTLSGDDFAVIASGSAEALSYRIGTDKDVMFRINVTGGSFDKKCYIDDFTLVYDGEASGVADVTTGPAGDMGLRLDGSVLTVTVSGGERPVSLFAADGSALSTARPAGGIVRITLPRHGIYIVKCGNCAKKIIY